MHGPRLPFQDPAARSLCANVAPSFCGLRATIEVDEVETPFGIITGTVEIGGEDDGGWHVIECSIPLVWDAGTRDMRIVSRSSLDRLERTIAEALAKYVTDDMATDALRAAMEE